MKNCIRPHYEKLKPLKSGFMDNSNFENNRDPWAKACTAAFVNFPLFKPEKYFRQNFGSHLLFPLTEVSSWISLTCPAVLNLSLRFRCQAKQQILDVIVPAGAKTVTVLAWHLQLVLPAIRTKWRCCTGLYLFTWSYCLSLPPSTEPIILTFLLFLWASLTDIGGGLFWHFSLRRTCCPFLNLVVVILCFKESYGDWCPLVDWHWGRGAGGWEPLPPLPPQLKLVWACSILSNF